MKKKMQVKSFDDPDELRVFENGKLELVEIGGLSIGRATFRPGWKWSKCVKPIAKTKSCQAPHFQYHVAGTFKVVMDDGSEKVFKPGDVSVVPPGHDAWVVGRKSVVVFDFQGMKAYAKLAKRK